MPNSFNGEGRTAAQSGENAGVFAGYTVALYHPDYTVGFGITPNLLTLPAKEGARGLGTCTPP
jgi:hypothetical protein